MYVTSIIATFLLNRLLVYDNDSKGLLIVKLFLEQSYKDSLPSNENKHAQTKLIVSDSTSI